MGGAMPQRRGKSSHARRVSDALRLLVDGIASKVADEVGRRFPEKERLRRIERQLARISRRLGSRNVALSVRRVGRPRSDRRCKVGGCGLPHVAHGFCSKHYQSWRRKRLREETA
jgi:hypothetical protein